VRVEVKRPWVVGINDFVGRSFFLLLREVAHEITFPSRPLHIISIERLRDLRY